MSPLFHILVIWFFYVGFMGWLANQHQKIAKLPDETLEVAYLTHGAFYLAYSAFVGFLGWYEEAMALMAIGAIWNVYLADYYCDKHRKVIDDVIRLMIVKVVTVVTLTCVTSFSLWFSCCNVPYRFFRGR
ncbi:hypothetical protein [Vibrio sp. MACH09]|uniref:hypothetical protein n=1 Tax=Vibrio sp. MACH09 TaxID=3025122 RepID=UPI00295E593D|nr:hypothetical protein [Vibrio sp. MACH09]